MRHHLLAAVSALALLPASALAQAIEEPTEIPNAGELDSLVEADAPAVAATPASTGDPVLDRLNALEAKIATLEARNKQLEAQAEFNEGRIEKVEVRAAKTVQPGIAPTFSDTGGNFTFKPRGMLQLDYAGYNERAGGYDYSNGTSIRRGRFGFDGTAYKHFKWRLDAEYTGQQANILDAYVSYGGVKNWVFTIGQHKAPYGLEANTSDAFNTFHERGMANNAFGAVGAERRLGISAAYQAGNVTATVGVFGGPESLTRNATTPDEGYGVNGRVTWEPVSETGKILHLGASGYHVTNLAGNSLTVSDRPNVRVDGGRIVSAAVAGATDATFYGAEAAVVYGPFSVQGEYGHLSVDRSEAAPTADFDGFYTYASYFITGESRTFKNGVVDRLKPRAEFNPEKGDWGAFELAVRYDQLDLTDSGLSPLDRQANSWTGAVNWYLNGNVKLMFNYIRFKGENSPLVVAPVAVNGTTAKGEAFATRLHLDF